MDIDRNRPGSEASWVGEVIAFWLHETPPEARFKSDAGLDATIRGRFASLHATLAGQTDEGRERTPREALATVIVLDQFSRNMFRGTATAFASDGLALAIATAAVDRGLDRALDADGRLFLYLPFEHSEDSADQDRAVTLIGAIGDPNLERYAIAHRDIIRRFGRFPHRNAALGRPSTPEETAFLAEPGSSF